MPAGALIGDTFGWRSAFFGSAALALLVLAAQLRLLTPVPPSRAVTVRDLLLPLRLPLARIGLLAIVLLFIGHFAAYTYLRPLLQQVFVLSPSTISCSCWPMAPSACWAPSPANAWRSTACALPVF